MLMMSCRVAPLGRVRAILLSLFLSRLRAMRAACPLMSLPVEAAVAEVLGMMEVLVFWIRICSLGMPSSLEAIVCILSYRPCPISTPPWCMVTEPSR